MKVSITIPSSNKNLEINANENKEEKKEPESSNMEIDAAKGKESHPSVSAFFKAYSQVSPKLKKARSKAQLLLVEQATDALNKLSKELGASNKGKSKKSSFKISVPSKKERMANLAASVKIEEIE